MAERTAPDEFYQCEACGHTTTPTVGSTIAGKRLCFTCANKAVAQTSKEDNELIQRVCRGVASIQEGERLRAYIAGLQSALERSQHQITLLVGAGRIPLKRAICARHGQIVETGCPDCERALGRIPVETVQAPSKNGNDLPARLRQLSGIMGGGASHHLNKAALEAADVIDRQRATIEFVNKQIRSVTPDWNAVVRWLDDSLALDGRADETSTPPKPQIRRACIPCLDSVPVVKFHIDQRGARHCLDDEPWRDLTPEEQSALDKAVAAYVPPEKATGEWKSSGHEICPRCQQTMPAGAALHTEHCPMNGTGAP